jgi:hypothetical protein
VIVFPACAVHFLYVGESISDCLPCYKYLTVHSCVWCFDWDAVPFDLSPFNRAPKTYFNMSYTYDILLACLLFSDIVLNVAFCDRL